MMPYFTIPERRVTFDQRAVRPDMTGTAVVEQGRQMSDQARGLQGDILKVRDMVQSKNRVKNEIELNKLENDIVSLGDDLITEHPDGVMLEEDFREKVKAYSESALENAPSYLRQETEAQVYEMVEKQALRLKRTSLTLSANALSLDFSESIDVMANNITRGSIPLEDALARAERSADALRELNPKAADSVLSAAKDSLLSADFLRVVNSHGPAEALRRFEETDTYVEMDSGLGQRLISNVKSTGKSEVASAISFATEQVRKSNTPNTSELRRARETAVSLGMDESVAKIDDLIMTGEEVYSYGQLPVDIRKETVQTLINKSKGPGLSRQEDLMLTAFLSHDSYMNSMMKSAPWRYAETINPDVSSMTELPVTGGNPPEYIKAAIDERKAIQQQMIDQYGLAMPFITDREIDLIRASYSGNNPQAKAGYLQMLNQVIPANEIRGVVQQINKKDDNLANYLAMSRYRPDTVAAALMYEDSELPGPDKKAMDRVLLEYSEAGAPQSAVGKFKSTIEPVYKRNIVNGQNPDDALENAVTEVAGPIISLPNGTTSVSFMRPEGVYITEREVDRTFKNLSVEDFIMMGVPKPDVPVDTMVEWAQLVPYSSQEFHIKKRGTNNYVYGSDGLPLLINMNDLVNQVERRARTRLEEARKN